MGVGIVLVYLVMVASLGSLRNPFVIVITLPLALIGALAALAVTGRTLGLPAMMGILLLIGIVVTNAIVLIAFVEQLRAKGLSVTEALITGGRVRLRPILMTALTTSFALLPLAVASADDGGIIGAEMATVVIGGLDQLHGADADRRTHRLHYVQPEHPRPAQTRYGLREEEALKRDDRHFRMQAFRQRTLRLTRTTRNMSQTDSVELLREDRNR